MTRKGSQHIKVRVDINTKVFVKRFLCESLFFCCEAALACWNCLHIPTLQTHMMIIRVRVKGTAT